LKDLWIGNIQITMGSVRSMLFMNRLLAVIALLIAVSAAHADIMVNDVSRLNPVKVGKIFKIATLDDIFDAVAYARERQLTVAIAGKRHSQGGQTAVTDGVVLDMTEYNKVSWLSEDDKTITVQSGATWAQIQKFINSQKLALTVMQSSNIFTVGGSMSVNAHGRDPRWGPIVDSIVSFHLVLASGKEVEVSRSKNYALFQSVIGGYGLFGVISEVKLKLTDNLWLNKSAVRIKAEHYIEHLHTVLSDRLALHYGRCAIAPNDYFFRDCIAVDYLETQREPVDTELVDEKYVTRDRFFFNLSRDYQWAKSVRWSLQANLVDVPGEIESISRNNAMRPPIKFLKYQSARNTDILQEYFVPIDRFNAYLEEMRQVLLQHQVNVLSMTLRYVKQSDDSYLNYATQESIAIVLYMNVGLDQAAQQVATAWTRELVDVTLKYEGKYYLTYQRYPTLKQFRKAYPNWKRFQQIKNRYDPERMFVNEFYKQYFPGP